MEMNTLTEIISNVGFPIAMCGALFYYMIRQNKSHSEELNQLRETLSENTRVLTELTTIIKMITDEKKG